MDHSTPAAASRNYHSLVLESPNHGNAYHHDAAGYQRQPPQYGYPYSNSSSSSSSSSSRNNSNINSHSNSNGLNGGRHAEYTVPAESRTAGFCSDDYPANKRARLGIEMNGQHRTPYDRPYASPESQFSPPMSASAAAKGKHVQPAYTAQRPQAPRPAENASLPRFSAPIFNTPSSYTPPAPHAKAPYHPPPSNAYAARPEHQNQTSSMPSPPVISPLHGSPYSHRESIVSGCAPAAASPSSSSQSSSQFFASGPPVHEQFQPQQQGHASSSSGTTPAGTTPQFSPPAPAYVRRSADETPYDRPYPFHDVPYSGGPLQFQYQQPYATIAQQWAPTLPPDFEEREAYCDSRGVIRGTRQHGRGHPFPEDRQSHQAHAHAQHQQHPDHGITEQPEGDNDAAGWEPDLRLLDSEPSSKSTSPRSEGRQHASGSAAAAGPSRAAPLRDILHPVNETPLMKHADLPVQSGSAGPQHQQHQQRELRELREQREPREQQAASGATTQPKVNKRGSFSREKRDETSQTRIHGACLRCKSQRVRCVPSPLGPYNMCVTCEKVSRNSKKVLHSIRCVRWRLTTMTMFRRGGLDLTKRWKGTEVHNIEDWVSDEIKDIDLKLFYSSPMHRYDLCDTPVKLRIREFAPQPDDVLIRRWVKRTIDADGTPKIEKKVAKLPAFALADVEEAEKALDSYFKENMINAMYDATRHCMPIIREHYDAAIRHYQSLPEGDFEKKFLEKFFRFWFYTRFTTGSSYISGGDTLGCKPVDDPDYPLGHRISVPRMITAQCDSIMVTKFLQPLSHELILELEKIFRTGNPDNWFTLYICTFMLLGEVSFSSQDRRRHGAENWITNSPYSLYEFVSDLQFGGNILLCYWHYYRTMDPMDSGWDIFCQVIEPPLSARNKVMSAKGKGKKKVHITLEQRKMVMAYWPRMVELAEILSTVHHSKSFEHPLYFVSQMYMREWEIREVYTYGPPGMLNKTRRKKNKR